MGMKLGLIEPLERVTLGNRVHEELCDLLMAGRLVPGEKLSLRNVAKSMGVSVMPVREAVTRLVAEGALEVSPNRAVSVPIMTRQKLQELTMIRCEIEGFAVAKAALNRTQKDIKRIRQLDEQFRETVRSAEGKAEKGLKFNKELHFAIYRAARLPLLESIIQGLWLKIGPVINLDLGSSETRLRSGDAEACHALMVAAIVEGDAEAARSALVRDISTSSQYIQSTGALPE